MRNWAKTSTDCYFMHKIMLGYTKWEYWSSTITKGVQCLVVAQLNQSAIWDIRAIYVHSLSAMYN